VENEWRIHELESRCKCGHLSNNGIEPTAHAPYDATERIMNVGASRIIVRD
jgi:hypothetical protein